MDLLSQLGPDPRQSSTRLLTMALNSKRMSQNPGQMSRPMFDFCMELSRAEEKSKALKKKAEANQRARVSRGNWKNATKKIALASKVTNAFK